MGDDKTDKELMSDSNVEDDKTLNFDRKSNEGAHSLMTMKSEELPFLNDLLASPTDIKQK